MIHLSLIGNDYKYEIENVIQLFFPDRKISATEGEFLQIVAKQTDDKLSVEVKQDDKVYTNTAEPCENDNERIFCRMLFDIFKGITGITPAWGIQTGVRPTKLLRSLSQKHGEDFAKDYLQNKLLISDEKFALAKRIVSLQDKLISHKKDNSFSLYISIPFCVSRCSYCSFVSHDIEKSKKLIPEYVALLLKEIRETAQITKDLGLVLQSVYIGGGTPTTLEADMLSSIMREVTANFDMSGCLEFTVEAGRPDTITKEKLLAIKQNGATRISINPQTLNDDVLKVIKRKHTVQEFYDSYNLAYSLGIENINTDLIAGLPSDRVDSFCKTIDEITALSPSCVTVHCLSVKRSSTIVYNGTAVYNPTGQNVSDMLEYSHKTLDKSGYNPYYMYRQSKMSGNNENIGWAKSGFESYYNMFIMEEIQPIIALGAGASTKLVDDSRIERIFNYKYPYEYISGFCEILNRKRKIYEFYNN